MKISSFYLQSNQNKNIFNNKSKYISICIYFSMFLFIFMAKSNFSTMSNVTNIFIWTIIPSLFPFILFNNLLINSNYYTYISNSKLSHVLSKIFKTNIYGATSIIVGFTIGFPNAAKYLNEIYTKKYISKYEASRLMLFVNNPSPVYILSAIGIGIFGDIKIGVILLISCIISSLIIAFFSSFSNTNINKEVNFINNLLLSTSTNLTFSTITKSILDTFISLAYIFGFMAIFSILFSIIYTVFNMGNNIFSSILSSIFEISMRSKNNISS